MIAGLAQAAADTAETGPLNHLYAIVAGAVFVVAYALIAMERFHKTLVALAGAAVVVILPVINSDEVFFSRETGVDWDVIYLLLGMMIIVSVVRQTGVFEYVAIWAAKRANGSPLRILILLIVVTGVASAILDNVTTVLLIAPVTLLVCDRLDINPAPFLMAEAFASNIGGTATLVGDPSNIIIADRANLTFNAFLIHLVPIVVIVLLVFAALLRPLFPRAFTVDPDRVADVMALDEREAIHDRGLLIKCGIVLVAVFAGFVAHKAIHMEPSLVAMVGAGVLILISGLTREFYLVSVEWETLLFFSGLFIMVGALVKTGVISGVAHWATQATGGNAFLTTILILVVSFVVSGIVNNVPYAASMTPVVAALESSVHLPANSAVLWWALALGTGFGGNLTAVGASANVVVIGMAERAGYPISFWEFTRKGTIVTAVSLAFSAGYLWLRYFFLA